MRRDAGHDSPTTQSSAPAATDPEARAPDIDAYRVVADCLTAITLRLDVAIAALDPGADPAISELLLSLQGDAHRAIAAFGLQPDANPQVTRP